MRKNLKKIIKLLSLIANKVYRNGIYHGVAASIEHEKLFKNYNFNTVIDIGANKGQFALLARKSFPNADIYSFEPLSKPSKILNKLFLSDANTKIFNYAIGPKIGTQTINVSNSDDSSSLLEITDLQNKIFPGTQKLKTEEIRVSTLDNLISKNDLKSLALLKLDVQGYEYEALLECKEILDSFYAIYCECSFIELYKNQKLAHDIIIFLDEQGFKLDGFYNSSYDIKNTSIQSDLFFIRK